MNMQLQCPYIDTNSPALLLMYLSVMQILLNSLEDSIMLCDYVAARKTWIIRFVNQPWIRMTGTRVPVDS